jgi:hypothetical protein
VQKLARSLLETGQPRPTMPVTGPASTRFVRVATTRSDTAAETAAPAVAYGNDGRLARTYSYVLFSLLILVRAAVDPRIISWPPARICGVEIGRLPI